MNWQTVRPISAWGHISSCGFLEWLLLLSVVSLQGVAVRGVAHMSAFTQQNSQMLLKVRL